MCTVTFIPGKNGIYLSSNRDEQHTRGQALFPARYRRRQGEIIYPKDKDAGGSWIALRDNGDAAVLLNGAFHPHRPMPPYRKSRGIVFLEMVKTGDMPATFDKTDLTGIQPFTLVLFTGGRLFECRWDGSIKYQVQLPPSDPHIWSSVTLYDEEVINSRKQWLKNWYASVPDITTATVLDFHRFTETGDNVNGLVMNRDGKVGTVSITSVRISGDEASMTYLDLKADKQYCEKISKRTASFALKRRLIRLFHWEYWPMYAVYAPVSPYWAWLSLRARTFFWFSASNPSIYNAGFLLESKKEIYDLIPPQYYPKTLFCRAGDAIALIRRSIQQMGLIFPLIAKPDVGQRGVQVELLQGEAGLVAYATHSRVNFLLQEYIDYPNEAGIFYYRIPGQQKGHISGIVGKELLAVVGDGRSTIEELLLKEDRYILQLPVLRVTYGNALGKILPAGVSHTLVPYGNHCRGAKFIDWSDRISGELENTIDTLCRQVPGFYFGRLDIKFDSWEGLCAGQRFSVIELNGAGSEPTHIYDPKHSILFAWKEIVRHWRIVFRISQLNARRHKVPKMSTGEGLSMLRENKEYLKLLS